MKTAFIGFLRMSMMAGVFASGLSFCSAELSGQDESGEIRKQATWDWPQASSFEAQLESFMLEKTLSEQDQMAVLDVWLRPEPAKSGPELLDRLVAVLSRVEPRCQELLVQVSGSGHLAAVPDMAWIDAALPGWAQDTMKLAVARSLVQRRWYDEALGLMSNLKVDQVVDPSSLLFYRAVCTHHLLKKDECLDELKLLLEREKELPLRYSTTAKLMLADLEPLKTDSLDEVARLMNDVGRRLDLGRAGKVTRDGEQLVLDKLDKLIEQVEQQMQQQQQQQQQGSQSQSQSQQQQQSNPMEESQIGGGSGPGDVESKDIGDKSGWGNLPPAQRQEALQRMTKDLPSHYREAIEEYFRKLATQPRK